MAKRVSDEFTRKWITENAVEILERYEPGILTIRALHYQLVSIGMTNTLQHYKRVVAAMGVARWEGIVSFDAFSDRDRSLACETNADQTNLESIQDEAKRQIGLWMRSYSRNRWENQPYYPEIFIEKKALEGVFYKPCRKHGVALGACKGYPSLTFLHEATERFIEAEQRGQKPIILYFGDYDPSGEDIPRALEENIKKMGCPSIEVRRISLMEQQVLEWKLPPAPAKQTDSRTANWDGLGQVELDAVKPEKLIDLLDGAISEIFDWDLFDQLTEEENSERELFQTELKRFVKEEL
ncbi:DNA topoisomerase [Elizabethkingia phage TCUEAP2]|nr:DNA topoisomerase [Elizabethkingia phage TCUEAP2]